VWGEMCMDCTRGSWGGPTLATQRIVGKAVCALQGMAASYSCCCCCFLVLLRDYYIFDYMYIFIYYFYIYIQYIF